ncbi:N-acetylneuraminate synthase [bacterium]|nr:MAG: N-acetylneuraminate synthase [bacterium]
MKEIRIGKHLLSKNGPLYFIADIAANHDGDINRAFKLIELAKECGAQAAKFQNFQANKIVSRIGFDKLPQSAHQKAWKKSVYETYQDASISFDWTAKLKAKCDEIGIEYLTSPYDFDSIEQVDPYVNAYKIGSGDITWMEIIEHMAKKGKPVILATGASSMEDVERAMRVLQEHIKDIVLMQCNTNYTANLENFKYINLKVLKTYAERYPKIVLGLSDHTHGHATILGAIALGATVFEKHFTDDNRRNGPDHSFAMNPTTWKEMIDRAKELFDALGDGIKIIEENEKESVKLQRRSVRAKIDLPADTILIAEMLENLRPILDGELPPYLVKEVIGKKLTRAVKTGEAITLNICS